MRKIVQGQYFPPTLRSNQYRVDPIMPTNNLVFSNVNMRGGNNPIKRNSQVQSNNLGKQQNIITNLKSQLTNLKQQVAKLMTKDSSTGNIETQKNIPHHSYSIPLTHQYSNTVQHQYYNLHNRGESVDYKTKDQSQYKLQNQKLRLENQKLINDNQKIRQQLKNTYARQKQLLNQRAIALEITSKQKNIGFNEKQTQLLKKVQQIENLKNKQNLLENQLQKKNKFFQNQKNKFIKAQTEFNQLVANVLQEVNNKNNTILQLKNQITKLNQIINEFNEQLRKKNQQLQMKSIQMKQLKDNFQNKIKNQSQIKIQKLQQNTYLIDLKNKIILYEKQIMQKDQKIQSFQLIIKTLSQDSQKFIKDKQLLQIRLSEKITKKQQKILLLQKQLKQAKDSFLHLQSKLNNYKYPQDQNYKKNDTLNSINQKKKIDQDQLKSQLKIKEKTINNLCNDVKHLQSQLRHSNGHKSTIKTLNHLINTLNQEKLKNYLIQLNSKYEKIN